jgi:signal transduction histidine kinase
MLGLFSPAVRVMNRLRYPLKFMLVGLLLLIPTIVLLTQYIGSINHDIRFAADEQLGLEYNAPIVDLLQALQEHALYSGLVQDGRGQEYSDDLQAAAILVRERMNAAEAVNARLGDRLRASDEFAVMRAGVLLLLSRSGGMSLEQTRAAHTAVQEDVLDMITVIGNNSNLILDPDIDSYYLMDTVITKLPRTLYNLSQLEMTGVAAIQAGLPEEQRLRMVLLSEITLANLDANAEGFAFAFEYNPALVDTLQTTVEEVFGETTAFLFTTARFENRSGTVFQFHSQVTNVRNRNYALYDAAERELDTLLSTRIAGFEAQRNGVIAVAAIAVLASVYFFVGFYLAVRRTIDDLRRTSDSMISGKLQQSMMFDYHDEFEEVVTAFNNVANEMVAARDRAMKASRLKDEFLATMSHELRTPLNSIIGYTGILMSGMRGTVDDTAKGLLGRVRESSHNLLNLINDILDIAKIEAGRMDIVEAPFVLNDLIASLHAQADVLARQKQINLEVVVDPELPGIIIGDVDKLGQVVRNLLSNAVKFTEEGVVRLKVYGKGETLHFEVSDTGIGIPPQALDYIFDEFRQVDGSTRRVYGGTGLGLSIVRKFCLAMGGRITLQSKLGAGSTFTAIVPLRVDVSQTSSAVRSAT